MGRGSVLFLRAVAATFKVSRYGRVAPIAWFRDTCRFRSCTTRCDTVWQTFGLSLSLHREVPRRCIVDEFRNSYPSAYDRSAGGGAPQELGVLRFMARLREEPDSEDGSSPDEGVPGKFAGHRGVGDPVKVRGGLHAKRVAGVSRALAARIPSIPLVSTLEVHLRLLSPTHGAPRHREMLVSLAMGKINECPSPCRCRRSRTGGHQAGCPAPDLI